MCNQLGLEDGELSLAEIVWDRAERAMQGKPLQQARLLKSEVILRNNKQPPALTQAELQMLTRSLSGALSADEAMLEFFKGRIDQLWYKSNPNDKDSETYFNMMNYYRNEQRKLKRQHKVLAGIQHKLKQAR